jgi:hypothetical protein
MKTNDRTSSHSNRSFSSSRFPPELFLEVFSYADRSILAALWHDLLDGLDPSSATLHLPLPSTPHPWNQYPWADIRCNIEWRH